MKLDEVYYNKEWTVTNILKWIKEYGAQNNLELKLVEKKALSYGPHKTRTLYHFTFGPKFIILIADLKVPGAPRLNEVEVVIGKPSTGNFMAKDAMKQTSIDGDQAAIKKMLDTYLSKHETDK